MLGWCPTNPTTGVLLRRLKFGGGPTEREEGHKKMDRGTGVVGVSTSQRTPSIASHQLGHTHAVQVSTQSFRGMLWFWTPGFQHWERMNLCVWSHHAGGDLLGQPSQTHVRSRTQITAVQYEEEPPSKFWHNLRAKSTQGSLPSFWWTTLNSVSSVDENQSFLSA